MASNDNRNSVTKKAGTLNSKWLQNTLKSMGVAGTQVIKDLMPATSTTISSGSKLVTDAARSIRSNKGGIDSLQRALKNNPAVSMVGELVNNAVSDIKSGNFYNSEREMQSSAGDFGFDDLDDDIFGDLEDYADEGNDVNVQNNFVSKGEDTYGAATLKAVQQQTEYSMKASKATVDAMVSISSAAIMKTNELGSQMLSELSTINKNLAAMVIE